MADRDPAIEVMTDGDLEARATAPTGLRADLQRAAIDTHGVVARHDARLFMAKNRVEIGRSQRDEGTPWNIPNTEAANRRRLLRKEVDAIVGL
jgi:hypothetical protein